MKLKKNKAFYELKNSINEEDEILANIRWFSKFSLEKRFEISEKDAKAVLELRNLKIENNEKSK